MKAKHYIYILATLLIFLSSCREISVSTIVNEDGSFTRIITITNDSDMPGEQDLPYPVDESWERSEDRDTTGGGVFTVIYTKTYENSDLLNIELEQDTGLLKVLDRNITVEKRFWFFNSYLIFEETWKSANPFTQLDYADYLSEEDQLWISGHKLAVTESDSIKLEEAETKMENYLKASISFVITNELIKGLEALNLSKLNGEVTDLYHDSILVHLESWDFDSSSEFIDLLALWTGKPEILDMHANETLQFDQIDKDIELLEGIIMMEPFNSYVEMPGIITETNSNSFKGNQVSWKISGESFLFKDNTMIVESRIVNTWAYFVSGILLLLLIVVLIVKARK